MAAESVPAVELREHGFAKFLRWFRHPVRIIAMLTAALCLTWGIALTAGLVSAALGALLGVVVGEMLGRSKLRIGAISILLVVVGLSGWGLASLSTESELIPRMMGPAGALKFASILRYGGGMFAIVAFLRAVAVRAPGAMALELIFVVVSVATLFAAHRQGIIARPLWLSDWAWRQGYDPADVLLWIGGSCAGVMTVLLLLERKGGLNPWAGVIPLVILGAVACLDFTGRPTPTPEDGIGLADQEQGDPPNPAPPDAGPGHQPGEGQDGGGGSQQDQGDGGGSQQNQGDGGGGGGGSDGGADGGGGGGGSDGGADGGGGGGSDGGSQMPPPDQSQNGDPNQGPVNTEPDLMDRPPPDPSSPAPMAVVIFENDYSPPSQHYYFRQSAWSEFAGLRLVPATLEGADRDLHAVFPTRPTQVEEPPPINGRTEVITRIALLVRHDEPFALEAPVTFSPRPNPNPERFVQSYRAVSRAQSIEYRDLIGLRAGDPEWSEEIRAHYLQPHPDPRFLELAEEYIGDLPPHVAEDPFARALSIKLKMDETLSYSTQERHAGVEDPTADFLFGNKIGYCVHFAHAAVYLWRSVGIPARIGVGYMVPEENRQGGSALVIRSGDAHAWPELYLEGVGWVILDIQAHEILDPPGPAPDEDLQDLLGDMAREEPPDEEAGAIPETEIGEQGYFDWFFWEQPAWLKAMMLLSLALWILFAIKLGRGVFPKFAAGRGLPRARYREMLDRLGEAGYLREYGETREAFARRVGQVAPTFEKLTELHVAARLGNPAVQTEARPEFQRGVWNERQGQFQRELTKGTSFWRRLLGLLHPASFFASR